MRYFKAVGVQGGIGCQLPTPPPDGAATPQPLHVVNYSNRQKFIIRFTDQCTSPLVGHYFIRSAHFWVNFKPPQNKKKMFSLHECYIFTKSKLK